MSREFVFLTTSPSASSRSTFVATRVAAAAERAGVQPVFFSVGDFDAADVLAGRTKAPSVARFLEAVGRAEGLVLSTPGCSPVTLWARFLAGPGAEEELSVTFHVSGVGMTGAYSAVLPWVARGTGFPWDGLPGWGAQSADALGHGVDDARRAAAFLLGMVREAVADAWAAALVRRACGMVAPDRVVELARELAVEQVMEG